MTTRIEKISRHRCIITYENMNEYTDRKGE